MSAGYQRGHKPTPSQESNTLSEVSWMYPLISTAPDILAKFFKKSNQALQWTKFLEFWIQVSVARSPRSRKDFFEFLKKYSGVCRHNNLFLCPWGLLGKAKGLPWRSGGLNQSWKLYIFVTLSYFGGKSPLNDSLYLILLFLSVVICFLPVKSVVSETVQCVE